MEILMAKPLKLQIVQTAKELIQDEQHWCRGYLAVDDYGLSVDPAGPDAVKRWALGALIAAAYRLTNNNVWAHERASTTLRNQYDRAYQRPARPCCRSCTFRRSYGRAIRFDFNCIAFEKRQGYSPRQPARPGKVVPAKGMRPVI